VIEENGGPNIDFLDGQGWYDNVVMADPLNENRVYVGGVDIFSFGIVGDSLVEENQFLGTTNNTPFIGLTNFTDQTELGILVNDRMNPEERVSVEIRFGPDLSQNAHRFTVGLQGSGVPDNEYEYEDYVAVPFEVWDIDNNRQLMVSFRDQQEDGEFNLINQNTGGDGSTHSREYLFINLVDYSETPDPDIAQNGGHIFQELCFIWPFLIEGEVWDPENIPPSTFNIFFGTKSTRFKQTVVISDGRSQYQEFNNGQVVNSNEDIHVDHHGFFPLEVDAEQNFFSLFKSS
jgi:hypothetical protein